MADDRYFAIGLDLSQLEKDMKEGKKMFDSLNEEILRQSRALDSAFAGTDLTSNFKKELESMNKMSFDAFSELTEEAQHLMKEMQEDTLSLSAVEKMLRQLNAAYREGKVSTQDYIDTSARLTVLHTNIADAIWRNEQELEVERISLDVVGDSITSMQTRVALLTTEYMKLSKAQRESSTGEGILKDISDLQEQLLAAQAGMQKYGAAGVNTFNSLSFSVQQVVRELPSLAMGPQMFFLAISNNLPVFADALARARKEYQALTASGKTATPVWKQLLSSLLSWQTALAAGVTLLVTHGDEIVNWVGSLFKAKKGIDSIAEVQKQLNEMQRDGTLDAQSEIARLDVLYKATQDQTKSLKERNDAADELQRKYPEYFGNLTNEAILAGNASTAYRSLTENILKAAQARAAMKIIEDNYNKIYQLQRAINADTNWTNRNREKTRSGTAIGKAAVGTSVTGYVQTVDVLTDEAKEYNRRKKALEDNTKAVKALEAANDALVKSMDISALSAGEDTQRYTAVRNRQEDERKSAEELLTLRHQNQRDNRG